MKFLRLGIAVFTVGLAIFVFAGKAMAAPFTVTNTADSGAGSLRQAILDANANGGADIIDFAIIGIGPFTITPTSNLPSVTDPVLIDGTSQSGASACVDNALVPVGLPAANSPYTLLIEINGSGAAGNILDFGAGSSGSEVKGLVLNSSPTSAINISAASIGSFTFQCNYIGTNTVGSAAAANSIGIRDDNGGNTLTIQNNLISGNTGNGVFVGYDLVTLSNNLIGTNAAGTAAIANAGGGVYLYNPTDGVAVTHNIISGNGSYGGELYIANNFSVTGNYAGLGVTGTAIGNGGDGLIIFGSNNFSIGGTSAAARNVVSANSSSGLHIFNNCTSSGISINSTTYNNYIGTKADGSVQSGFGNGSAGVEVNEYYGGCVSVYGHRIGGDASGQSNIIAGNTKQGVLIHQASGYDVFSITVINNAIYANGQFGIDLAADSDNNSGTADVDLGPNAINSFAMSYPATNANYYINHPVITSTNFSGNNITVNYNFQAPGVTDNLPSISAADVVGYRLDFYLNDNAQDSAYSGYNQGKKYLGSFIINSSATNASHTFSSVITPTANMSIDATATVLWTTSPSGGRSGTGPPYI